MSALLRRLGVAIDNGQWTTGDALRAGKHSRDGGATFLDVVDLVDVVDLRRA
jgi:hypothetical protein